jgi:hypothetical protein
VALAHHFKSKIKVKRPAKSEQFSQHHDDYSSRNSAEKVIHLTIL